MIDIHFYTKIHELKQKIMKGESFDNDYLFDEFERCRRNIIDTSDARKNGMKLEKSLLQSFIGYMTNVFPKMTAYGTTKDKMRST